MKKTILLIMTILVAALFTGCAADSKNSSDQAKKMENEDGGSEKPMEGMHVGVAFPTLATEFYSDIADGIERIAVEQGAEVDIISCEMDSNLQMQQIENFATMGVTHLIIQSYDMESMVETLKKVRENGMYVASFGVAPSDLEAVDIIPGCIDSNALGETCAKQAGEWIEKTFPDAQDKSIEVGVIVNTTTAETNERSQGFLKVEEYSSKAKVAGTYDLIGADDSGTKAQEYLEIMMEEHPDIKCVIVYDGVAAVGVNESAMHSSRIKPEEFGVFGCDYTTTMGELIQQSGDNSSVLRGAVQQGDDMAQMLVDAITGKLDDQVDSETKAYNMELFPITIDNLDEFYTAEQ